MAQFETQTQTQTQGSEIHTLESQQIESTQKRAWGRLISRPVSIKTLKNNKSMVIFKDPIVLDIIDEVFKIGRLRNACDFELTEAHLTYSIMRGISKIHFRIYSDISDLSNPVYIQDCSTNGTFLNNELIGKKKSRIIQTGDKISVSSPIYAIFVFENLRQPVVRKIPKEITSKYFVCRDLGQGAFGIVSLVYDLNTSDRFAMKQVNKKRLSVISNNHIFFDPARIMNEIRIMKALKHPCVINMHDFIDLDNSVFMVLEFMEGGDLIGRIINSKLQRLSESTAKLFFFQMCHAVNYLHENGITHRDLKPDNILLMTNEEETLLKVTDFGLSKLVQNESVMKTLCGTPQYVAPEIISTAGHGSYTAKVDVWSLGCCLFACLVGSLPFHADNQIEIMKQVVKGKYKFDARWINVSFKARKIVQSCLTQNPESRPSIKVILEETWLRDDYEMIAKAELLLNIKLRNQKINIPTRGAKNERREYYREPPSKRSRLDNRI